LLALDAALAMQAELENRAAEADTLRRRRVKRARHAADAASDRLAPRPAIPQSRPDEQALGQAR